MQKTLSLFMGILFALTISAEQMPKGYYDALNGQKDEALKTAIHKIMNGGRRYDYGSQGEGNHTKDKIDDCSGDTLHKAGDPRYGTWSAYPFTDLQSDGTIWGHHAQSIGADRGTDFARIPNRFPQARGCDGYNY